MSNFLITFNIVAPFMLYMLFGMLLKKIGLITNELNGKLSTLTSMAFLPIFNFNTFLKADLSGLAQGGYVLYIVCGNLLLFGLMILATSLAKVKPGRAGSMSITTFVSNTMIFGNAIALSMYGEGNFAPVALVAAVLLPVYNGLTVPVLQVFGAKQAALSVGGNTSAKTDVKKILRDIAMNPLIWAVVAGLICCSIKVQFPSFVNSFLTGVSNIVSPLIFVTLGAGFTVEGFSKNKKHLIICLALKLIINPLIFIILPLKWGFRDQVLLACLMAFAAPCGVTTVPISKACGCDDEFSGQMVAMSSLLAIISVFFWILILKNLGVL